ncbi:PTS sugar transporter subunit IID [Natranaerobius trueperi]|uniref:PTS sugar transporter subunit IID n=1 Tax=Natranaerobius trueperi TaxID=759412 RepID=A0A226BZP2_9FIRM|nr:PTS sugar transporter subunit IID [Natranaerobius trueperi]
MKQITNYLKRKDIEISIRRYGIDALGHMALGLFGSLIVGLILRELGDKLGIAFFIETVWPIANDMTGPAIGVAVAYGLNAPPLVIFSSAISGMAGAEVGGPAGAFLGAVVGAELGKLVSKETKIDIVLTPAVTIITGTYIGSRVGPMLDFLMSEVIGDFLIYATELHPIPMGAIIAVSMGLLLTFPVSSAALAIMLDLSGIAAGAAAVGCASQMIGFAVSSYRENKIGGLLAQGIGTSMLQIPNIVKNPLILIPPTLTSAILGPFVTTIFRMENTKEGAGMGTSGFVGQFGTIAAMEGQGFQTFEIYFRMFAFHFIFPAIIALIISELMRKKGYINSGDMKLDI